LRSLVLHQVLLAGTARHHDDIERRAFGKDRRRHDPQATIVATGSPICAINLTAVSGSRANT
jgi:hypothetical protein